MKLEDKVITGIATSDEDISITLREIDILEVSSVFEDIAEEGIIVDMISQTTPTNNKVCLSFTIPKEDINKCRSIVKNYVKEEDLLIEENITKFSLVGLGMKHTFGVASKVFKIFKENNIKVKLIATSEIRITCAISSYDKQVAIDKIGKEFNM